MQLHIKTFIDQYTLSTFWQTNFTLLQVFLQVAPSVCCSLSHFHLREMSLQFRNIPSKNNKKARKPYKYFVALSSTVIFDKSVTFVVS